MERYWSVEDCAWVERTRPPPPQPVTVDIPEQSEPPVEVPAPALT